jgi:hypothetical protein
METKEDQGGTIVVLAKACEVQMGPRWAGRVMVLQMTPVYIQLRECSQDIWITVKVLQTYIY